MPRQHVLPLGEVDPPEHLMRAAYERCRLNISFEAAMESRAFRIGLKNTAIAMARRTKGRKKR